MDDSVEVSKFPVFGFAGSGDGRAYAWNVRSGKEV